MSLSGEGLVSDLSVSSTIWVNIPLGKAHNSERHRMKTSCHRQTAWGLLQRGFLRSESRKTVGFAKPLTPRWGVDQMNREATAMPSASTWFASPVISQITTVPKHPLASMETPHRLLNRQSSCLKIRLYSKQWFCVSIISSDLYKTDFRDASYKVVKIKENKACLNHTSCLGPIVIFSKLTSISFRGCVLTHSWKES